VSCLVRLRLFPFHRRKTKTDHALSLSIESFDGVEPVSDELRERVRTVRGGVSVLTPCSLSLRRPSVATTLLNCG
jgi:hypothetical protein